MEVKNVAASTKVIVSQEDLLSKFSISSLGSGAKKMVFLKYNVVPGKPNRFIAKDTQTLNLIVDELVNLDLYERKIRRKLTDLADVQNFVYKSSSPGFYPVGNWLKQNTGVSGNPWTIFGRHILEYNGYNDLNTGPNLDVYGKFTHKVEIPSETPPS